MVRQPRREAFQRVCLLAQKPRHFRGERSVGGVPRDCRARHEARGDAAQAIQEIARRQHRARGIVRLPVVLSVRVLELGLNALPIGIVDQPDTMRGFHDRPSEACQIGKVPGIVRQGLLVADGGELHQGEHRLIHQIIQPMFPPGVRRFAVAPGVAPPAELGAEGSQGHYGAEGKDDFGHRAVQDSANADPQLDGGLRQFVLVEIGAFRCELFRPFDQRRQQGAHDTVRSRRFVRRAAIQL